MQLVIINKLKIISVVFLLISAIGATSVAQAGSKSYRSGHKGGFGLGYKGSYGYKGGYGYKSSYGYKGSYSRGNNYRSGYSNSYRRNYSYGHKGYNRGYKRSYSSNSYYPYRNYAFRSYNDNRSKKVILPDHKSATTVIIAGAATAAVNSEKNTTSKSTDTVVTCYDYKLTSVGGIGGFKFNDAGSSIKIADDASIAGQFCGAKFVEFELAKTDENVSVNFEVAGNVFKFPANSESVQQDGWQKKFFTVNFKKDQ